MRELIDRAALIAEYDRVHVGAPGGARKLMEDAPTIEERKKGEWILPNNPIAVSLNEWICSECKYLIDGKHNFCPNCGADMRGGQDG